MKHCIVLLLLVLFSCQSSDKSPATYNIESVASAEGTEVFQDNWDNIRENYKFPEWFQDAKFGIFIHWGIYSIPVPNGMLATCICRIVMNINIMSRSTVIL